MYLSTKLHGVLIRNASIRIFRATTIPHCRQEVTYANHYEIYIYIYTKAKANCFKPSHGCGFYITHIYKHGLCDSSEQQIALHKGRYLQNTDKHKRRNSVYPCSQQDSNPRSQKINGASDLGTWTARSLRSANTKYCKEKFTCRIYKPTYDLISRCSFNYSVITFNLYFTLLFLTFPANYRNCRHSR